MGGLCVCWAAPAPEPKRAPVLRKPAPEPEPGCARVWAAARYDLFEGSLDEYTPHLGTAAPPLASLVRRSEKAPYDLCDAAFSHGDAPRHVFVELEREKRPEAMVFKTGCARVWEAAIALTSRIGSLGSSSSSRPCSRRRARGSATAAR